MRISRIHWPIRLLASVASMISVAVLLIGLAHPGRAEPPNPVCWSCYVDVQPVFPCQNLKGEDCTMKGCFGGNGQCRIGCRPGMMYLGEDCANVGCGWTQTFCFNFDCYCDDWE